MANDAQHCEERHRDGPSKHEAAATKGRSADGGQAGHWHRYDDWTVFDLKMRAQAVGLRGYFDKSRAQLIDMLRHH